MHARTKIRKKIIEILQALPLNGISVFGNPVAPLVRDEMPAVVVTTESETVDYETPSYPRLQDRVLEVHITAMIKASNNYEDILDELLLNLENELGKTENKTLGGLVNYYEVKNHTLEFKLEEKPYAEGKIIIEYHYRTLENDNETIY